jgi:sialidase-1
LTWSPVGDDPALVEPVCQASVLRLSTEQFVKPRQTVKHRTKNRIVFSNPASERRENMTVRLSYDQCKTWSAAKTLWPGPSAYSDLVLAADKRIGCLYERGRNCPYETVTFALFTLEWLTEGRDRL